MIRVEYFYNNEPYFLGNDTLDYNTVRVLSESFQNDYAEFAEKIISENGYLKIILSKITDGLHGDCDVEGISEQLRNEISAKIYPKKPSY